MLVMDGFTRVVTMLFKTTEERVGPAHAGEKSKLGREMAGVEVSSVTQAT